MADQVTPPAPSANPIVAAKAQAVAAITKKNTAAPTTATAATPPDKSVAELAKMSAKVRELEAQVKDPPSVKEARELYAKDPKAGLAKLLGVDAVDQELERLSAVFFAAPEGTKAKEDAEADLATEVAALKARAKADDEAKRADEEKAKETDAESKRSAARDATFKLIAGFVDADGVPEFPYCATVNQEEANGHIVRTANELASARKIDLATTPDDEVIALLREANGLVEAEYAELATKYASVVPKAKKDDTVTKTTPSEGSKPREGADKVTSAPVRTAIGNVAKPAATPIVNKTHVSIKEAKAALVKQLNSARRN